MGDISQVDAAESVIFVCTAAKSLHIRVHVFWLPCATIQPALPVHSLLAQAKEENSHGCRQGLKKVLAQTIREMWAHLAKNAQAIIR